MCRIALCGSSSVARGEGILDRMAIFGLWIAGFYLVGVSGRQTFSHDGQYFRETRKEEEEDEVGEH